jgi:hypothetical protein
MGRLKPWQALETATSVPAKAYVPSRDLGTPDAGHLADLVIATGDLLTNINDLTRVACVQKGRASIRNFRYTSICQNGFRRECLPDSLEGIQRALAFVSGMR